MLHDDFEREAEEGIQFAGSHNRQINAEIANGSGLEQYNALLEKYPTLAEDLEKFPHLVKHVLGLFSEKALWEVVHGEVEAKQHHKRLIKALYAFVEEHKDDLNLIEKEEAEEESREYAPYNGM